MNPVEQHIAKIVARTYRRPVRSPDAFRVAAALGVRLEHNRAPTGVGELAGRETLSIRDAASGRWTIYHDRTARRERQQFDVAHELIEQFLLDEPEAMGAWIDDPRGLHPDDFKELAHQLACYYTHQFLIRPDWFDRDFAEHGGELRELKRLYPHASHEVLAYAALEQYGARAMLTILDQPRDQPLKIYRRVRAGLRPVRGGLLEVEQELVRRCLESGECLRETRAVEVADWNFRGNVELRADPVFEPDWKRVLLFLLADEAEG